MKFYRKGHFSFVLAFILLNFVFLADRILSSTVALMLYSVASVSRRLSSSLCTECTVAKRLNGVS